MDLEHRAYYQSPHFCSVAHDVSMHSNRFSQANGQINFCLIKMHMVLYIDSPDVLLYFYRNMRRYANMSAPAPVIVPVRQVNISDGTFGL